MEMFRTSPPPIVNIFSSIFTTKLYATMMPVFLIIQISEYNQFF